MKNTGLTTMIIVTALASQPSFSAQTIQNTAEGSIVTYEKNYFEKYNAVTLLDMLQVIPGVKEILDENRNQQGGGNGQNGGERGFGSGGDQILLDGKRLAGKTNNINDTLGRISSDQIEKIELIRGAAEGLDVQSQGLVINVNLVNGASTSSTFWKVGGKYTRGHDFQPQALISHSGSSGRLDYTFSAERKAGGFNFERKEQIFDASGIKIADQFIDGGTTRAGFLFSTNLSYSFSDGGILRLNGLYETTNFDDLEIRDNTGDALRPVEWLAEKPTDEWEIGGDYTRNFGTLGSFKALFVVNEKKENEVANRFKGTGSDKFEYNRENSKEDASEKIIRLSLTNSLSSNQSLEWGGEVAINTVNGKFENHKRDTGADPFILTNSDVVDIKENRYEIFANHTYNFSSDLVLQSSLTTEFSKIVADNVFAGGTSTRRDTSFTYLKPRINLRYDITNSDQIRATAEKKVSQLDFGNFVTSFDTQTAILRLGNTNIRPEQIWEYSAVYEHRFANDGGSVEFEIFYHDFKDHITRVDFTEYEDFGGNAINADTFFSLPPTDALRDAINNGSGFISKSGNVDNASAYGFKFKSNIRLGFIGLSDAVFGLSYVYDKKKVIDQFTMLERSFDRHSDHKFNTNFRHDITDLGLSYGFSGEFQTDATSYDIRYFWPSSPHARLSVFAEYVVYNGIKLRIDAENLNKINSKSDFIGYNDHIRFNESYGKTERLFLTPAEITISLQGTF